MWAQFVGLIENSISLLHLQLGSWGLAIILFTIAVKAITWPLTSKQLKSSKAMQELQPRMKAIQEKHKDNREMQSQEMMKLYQEAGVQPLMGCLPMLLQLPIWFALFQAISKLAAGGRLQESFLFLPSLACPTTAEPLRAVCETTFGSGWMLNLGNLASTWPYLILPIITVVTQIGVGKLMSPPTAAPTSSNGKPAQEDPTQATMRQMNTIMPFMFGFFALTVPAGLALYWVTNNVLTYFQYWVLNRDQGSAPLRLAPAASSPERPVPVPERRPVLEVQTAPQELDYSEEPKNAKSRRKRKKR